MAFFAVSPPGAIDGHFVSTTRSAVFSGDSSPSSTSRHAIGSDPPAYTIAGGTVADQDSNDPHVLQPYAFLPSTTQDRKTVNAAATKRPRFSATQGSSG